MKDWKIFFVVALLFSVLAAPRLAAATQDEARVTAQLETEVVKLGEVVSCLVQVDGAALATLDAVPSVEGLTLERTSGPSIHESRSIIGRRVTRRRTLTWTVTFRPDRVGEFVIPPMRLTVDGKEVFTREVTLSVVIDMKGQDLGHLEFIDVPERVYEGQPFTVRMNFGWDSKLHSGASPVDFVANLVLPWWNELPGTLEVDGGAKSPSERVVEVSVNSRIRVRAVELGQLEIDGTPFRMLSLTRTFVATRSGRLDFPQSWLEFGTVKRGIFRDERDLYYVGTPAFAIEVSPLPEEGQPFEFSGGVGRFAVEADVNRRDVDVGESIKLTVDWTGDANLEFFELPDPSRLESFEGFRVYGTTNERFYGDRRRVVYDLAPLSAEIYEIPTLPLSVFDPYTGRYTEVATRPIPIRVRALEGGAGLPGEGGEGDSTLFTHDIQTQPESGSEGGGPGGGVVIGAWCSLTALWFASRTVIRRRGDPGAPAARRRRTARKRLLRTLRSAQHAGDQSRGLFEFLGARSGEAAEAWEGRDIPRWLIEQDLELDPKVAEALVTITGDLDHRHWAGDDRPLEKERVISVADWLLEEGF